MQPQWFETFFRDVAVDFWSLAMTPEMTTADVNFLEKTLEAKPGSRLLDVPCGTGRHSLELARRGYRMTGMDISADSLRLAREQASSVQWVEGDMRGLSWESEFDGAFCFGNSFGYLDHQAAGEFLRALARALRPGARLVIQTGMAAESILPALLQKRWHRIGDILMLSENRYAVEDSRLDIDYTFIRNGVIETRPSASYVFTVAELRRMLVHAGFEPKAPVGWSGEPYQLGSPGLILIAQKV